MGRSIRARRAYGRADVGNTLSTHVITGGSRFEEDCALSLSCEGGGVVDKERHGGQQFGM